MAKKTAFQKGVEFIKKQTKKKGGKRRQPGLLGKAGAILIGAVPLIVPVPGVIAKTQLRQQKNWTGGSIAEAGLKEYINGLAVGIGLGDVFPDIDIVTTTGATATTKVGSAGVPRGSTLGIFVTGLAYMLMDRFAQALNSGKGQNVPGTRTRLIGSG